MHLIFQAENLTANFSGSKKYNLDARQLIVIVGYCGNEFKET
ncbi:hypothetical protein GXM_05362 [Nostoc sphaeroides CCNUC1]|uniref:Uncharacterized protein n=1 Tax=Nostoc sphaeroides CCNUC1 TaxID=2653204 RepID=A0A5P8W5D9_9NOSO|nr:hypothetical protein GXM_05362 [Nostoc sphaeroides CCNUC1]